MKKFKSVLAILLLATSVCNLVACGGGTDSEDPNKGDKNRTNVLTVSIFDGGYGTGWLYELKRGFEDIRKDVYVDIIPNYSDANVRTELESGVSSVDIYFTKDYYYKRVDNGSVRVGKTTYDSWLADISDVVNGPAYGETEIIKSKFKSTLIDWFESSTGKYYTLPWGGGLLGMIVNTDILQENGWDVPVTTDEMLGVFNNIKEANLKNDQGKTIYATTICSTDDSMIRQPQTAWFAQYLGTEGWNDFWNGYDQNGERYQTSLLNNNGLLYSLEVCQEFLSSSNGYLHEYALSDTFISTEFRLFNKECVFLSYGDWVMNECATNFTDEELKDVRFIKFPVLSKIVEKLEDSDMSDETLAAIIREIDAGATSSDLCSAADFAIIQDARSINLSNANIHMVEVPCYSDNIDTAKDFLRYVYSDKGAAAFAANSRGNVWAVNDYDYDAAGVTLNNYAKSCLDIMNNSTILNMFNSHNRLFLQNGLGFLNGDYQNWPQYFWTTSSNDQKTARQIYEGNLVYVSTRWNDYIKNLD